MAKGGSIGGSIGSRGGVGVAAGRFGGAPKASYGSKVGGYAGKEGFGYAGNLAKGPDAKFMGFSGRVLAEKFGTTPPTLKPDARLGSVRTARTEKMIDLKQGLTLPRSSVRIPFETSSLRRNIPLPERGKLSEGRIGRAELRTRARAGKEPFSFSPEVKTLSPAPRGETVPGKVKQPETKPRQELTRNSIRINAVMAELRSIETTTKAKAEQIKPGKVVVEPIQGFELLQQKVKAQEALLRPKKTDKEKPAGELVDKNPRTVLKKIDKFVGSVKKRVTEQKRTLDQFANTLKKLGVSEKTKPRTVAQVVAVGGLSRRDAVALPFGEKLKAPQTLKEAETQQKELTQTQAALATAETKVNAAALPQAEQKVVAVDPARNELVVFNKPEKPDKAEDEQPKKQPEDEQKRGYDLAPETDRNRIVAGDKAIEVATPDERGLLSGSAVVANLASENRNTTSEPVSVGDDVSDKDWRKQLKNILPTASTVLRIAIRKFVQSDPAIKRGRGNAPERQVKRILGGQQKGSGR